VAVTDYELWQFWVMKNSR